VLCTTDELGCIINKKLVTIFPSPTKPQYEIFRIVIALAAGGVGAVVPGLLSLQMNLGLTSNQKVVLRAGGALAVFVVVYFYSPAEAIAPVSNSIVQINDGGDCNANIAGVSGKVTRTYLKIV